MALTPAEMVCTYLLKNMVSDYERVSGDDVLPEDFAEVPSGIAATLLLRSGDRVRVTVEVLGEPSQEMVNRFIESSK